ncbi:MAG: AmmeMemoRadiSam system protein B [Anaerolineales bacterium]
MTKNESSLMSPDVRPAHLAGRWYPDNRTQLRQTIDDYLAVDTPPPRAQALHGLLVPHAGMRYSGPVAGRAFAYLKAFASAYDTVVVIGPSHYPYNAPLITTAHTHYQTPLGTVPVARGVVAALDKSLETLPVRDDPEHAIEIELPFLQVLLANFELVPIAMLDQSEAMCAKLARILNGALQGRQTLFVASSDLSHFYNQATAHKLDQYVLDALQAYDPVGVLNAKHDARGLACGRGAIATMMLMLAANAHQPHVHLDAYATSGAVSGDYERVVGYAAATFWGA